MAAAPEFNMEAFDLQFDAVYGRHLAGNAYGTEVLYGLNTEANRAGWKVPLHDTDAVRNLAWRIGRQSRDRKTGVHYRVSPLRDREYRYNEAGASADMIALPCLVMDFDTVDGKHAPFGENDPFFGYRHPSREEIADLIADVMPDTFRTNTGGGIQSVFALSTPMDAQDPDMKALRQRIQARWADAAKARGFGIDLSVGVKANQTQRLAGSVNWKRPENLQAVTVLKEDDGTVYSIQELMAELPAPPPAVRVPRYGARAKAARAWSRIGDAFAAAVPVEFLMEEVFQMEQRVAEDASCKIYGRWSYPREDGTCSQESHAATMTSDKGIQVAFAHGNRLQGVWGVDSSSVPVTSWDLLLLALHQDEHLAQTIVSTYKEPSQDLAQAVLNIREFLETGEAA